jgi:hypothetical protein
MWVRKSEDEIQEYRELEEAKRTSLVRPLLFASVLTAISIILYLFGYRGGSLRSGVMLLSTPSSFTLGTVLVAVFFFVFFFAFAVFRQRRKTFHSPSDSLLCRECKQPSHSNPAGLCQCGGALEPFAFFTWTEDAGQAEH